jgi:hypothetical protein
MCIASLNRTTAACGHAYFHLTQTCQPAANLASCPGKVSLAGWEQRPSVCAFCSGAANLDAGTTYKLLGQDDSAAVPGGLSRHNSLSTMTTSSMTSARRDSRRGSLARSDSSAGSGGTPTYFSNTAAASDRNIYRNQRIDTYLAQLPENVYLTGRSGARTEAETGGGGGSSSGLSRNGSTSSGATGGGAGAATGVDAYAGAAKKFAKDKKKRLSRDLKGWLGS